MIVKKKPGCNIIISLQRGIHEHLTTPPFATPLKFIANPPVWYAGPLQKGAQNWTSFLDRVAVFIYSRSWGHSDCKCEVFSFFFQKGLSGRPANFAEMRDHTSSRWNHDDQIPLWNFLYVLKQNSAAKISNRFHVNVTERLFSNSSQMRSTCGGWEEMLLMLLPHFDVYCHLLLIRPRETWNLLF